MTRANIHGGRNLVLQHSYSRRWPPNDAAEEVLCHLYRLWGFPVRLERAGNGSDVHVRRCPPRSEKSSTS